ncbi:glycosyltransferase family 2 protein [uncultured Clostridium sp.]|uniref:glycosyltransferase family 2 protein n=1 Tax=uncultured Clostridium sp. TaxID=59620 RepID=UPI002671289C|nr:glycosyltransferase family 2 protein [uncultured Clostridium sp.]
MISVALATYNGEKYIKEQLISILNQTIKVDEIIICDDCSNDKTISIVKQILKMNSLNIDIKIVENKSNMGYIANFNQAIELTKGEYIFLADQDDIWEIDKVEKSIKFLTDNNYDAMCSKFKLIDKYGNEIKDNANFSINNYLRNNKGNNTIPLSRLVFGNISPGCTYCFNRRVKDIYLRVNDREVIHDYQIMLIAASVGKVGLIDEPLIKYRLHDNNSIGFSKKKRAINIRIHKIRKKPIMVDFFQKLNRITKVPDYSVYIIMYYLRIPHIKSKLRRLIFG